MLKKIKQNGQTIIEYTIVIGIILTVMIAMQPMIKRAGQGMIKVVADQIGNQQESDQRAFYPGSNVALDGHLEYATISAQSKTDTQTVEFLGLTNYIHADTGRTDSEQQSNLGFTPSRAP